MQNSIKYDILIKKHEQLQSNISEVTNNLKKGIKRIVSRQDWEKINEKINGIEKIGNNCDVLEEYIRALQEWSFELKENYEQEFQELLNKYVGISKQLKQTQQNLLVEEDANVELQFKLNEQLKFKRKPRSNNSSPSLKHAPNLFSELNNKKIHSPRRSVERPSLAELIAENNRLSIRLKELTIQWKNDKGNTEDLVNFIISEAEELKNLKVKFRKTGLKHRTGKFCTDFLARNQAIFDNAYSVCAEYDDSALIKTLVDQYEENKTLFLQFKEQIDSKLPREKEQQLIEVGDMSTGRMEGADAIVVIKGPIDNPKELKKKDAKQVEFKTHRKSVEYRDSLDEEEDSDNYEDRKKIKKKVETKKIIVQKKQDKKGAMKKSNRKREEESDDSNNSSNSGESVGEYTDESSDDDEVQRMKRRRARLSMLDLTDRIPIFTGEEKKVVEKLDTFLSRVKSVLCGAKRGEEEELFITLREKVEGKARQCFDKHDITTYARLSKHFRKQFMPPPISVCKLNKEIAIMKREKNETIITFGHRLLDKISSYKKGSEKVYGMDNHDAINDLAMDIFLSEIKGTKLDVLISVRKIETLERAMKMAEKLNDEEIHYQPLATQSTIDNTEKDQIRQNHGNYRQIQQRNFGRNNYQQQNSNQSQRFGGNSNQQQNFGGNSNFAPPINYTPRQNPFNRDNGNTPNFKNMNNQQIGRGHYNQQGYGYNRNQGNSNSNEDKNVDNNIGQNQVNANFNENGNVGCSYCGGMGHQYLYCPTLKSHMGKANGQS